MADFARARERERESTREPVVAYVAAFAYGRGRSSDVVRSPGCANIDRGVAVTKNSTERE